MEKNIEKIIIDFGRETKVFDYANLYPQKDTDKIKVLFVSESIEKNMSEKERNEKAVLEIRRYFGEEVALDFHIPKDKQLQIALLLDKKDYATKGSVKKTCYFREAYSLYSYNGYFEAWDFRATLTRNEKKEFIASVVGEGYATRFKGCFFSLVEQEEQEVKVNVGDKSISFRENERGFLIIKHNNRAFSFFEKLSEDFFLFDDLEESSRLINKTAKELLYELLTEKALKSITKKQKLCFLKHYLLNDIPSQSIEKMFYVNKNLVLVCADEDKWHTSCCQNGKELFLEYPNLEEVGVEISVDRLLSSFGKFDFLLKNLVYYSHFQRTNSLEKSIMSDRLLHLRTRRLGNENFTWFDDFKTIEKIVLKRKRRQNAKDRHAVSIQHIKNFGDKVFIRSEDGNKVGYSMIEYIIESYKPSENEYKDKIRADVLLKQVEGTIHECIVVKIIIEAMKEQNYPLYLTSPLY